MNFSDILRDLRIKKKLQQGELGKMFGYTQTAVYSWEKGRSYPPLPVLIQLADFFEVSLDFLAGHDNKTVQKLDLFKRITDSMVEVTPHEKELLKEYRILPLSQQVIFCKLLDINHPSIGRSDYGYLKKTV